MSRLCWERLFRTDEMSTMLGSWLRSRGRERDLRCCGPAIVLSPPHHPPLVLQVAPLSLCSVQGTTSLSYSAPLHATELVLVQPQWLTSELSNRCCRYALASGACPAALFQQSPRRGPAWASEEQIRRTQEILGASGCAIDLSAPRLLTVTNWRQGRVSVVLSRDGSTARPSSVSNESRLRC